VGVGVKIQFILYLYSIKDNLQNKQYTRFFLHFDDEGIKWRQAIRLWQEREVQEDVATADLILVLQVLGCTRDDNQKQFQYLGPCTRNKARLVSAPSLQDYPQDPRSTLFGIHPDVG